MALRLESFGRLYVARYKNPNLFKILWNICGDALKIKVNRSVKANTELKGWQCLVVRKLAEIGEDEVRQPKHSIRRQLLATAMKVNTNGTNIFVNSTE